MAKATTPKPGRVRIENVNHPGSSTAVDAGLYNAMREALLAVLPDGAPGMTESQMRQAVLRKLPEDLFPGGERAGWWSKAVQLDLEAKAIIVRESSRPLRWHRAPENAEAAGAPTPDSPARTRAEALNAELRRREGLSRR
ncbi:MAG: hypothetical protein A2V84_14260 [Chloroflexi bacterium RBG_16_70_13]|nr:MAG: hypothetical protein A2V84_14260 [Chloroflexi bacterium RBG_16_70_13]